MKKFKFLVKYGLSKRIRSKAFLISNIFVALLVITIANLPLIIGLFASEAEIIENVKVEIVNETTKAELVTDLSLLFNEPFEQDFYLLSELDVTQLDLDTFWAESETEIIIHFTGEITAPNVVLYSKSDHLNIYFMTLIENKIVYYQVGDYERPLFSTVYPPDYDVGVDTAVSTILANLVALPIFFLIIMATQFVGVDIIEEKSTKAIDTIIASVPAKTHFLSKITSSILFVVFQGFLTLIYGLIGLLIGGALSDAVLDTEFNDFIKEFFASLAETIPNWPVLLILTILFMIVGTLFYLVIASLFSSMAVNQEDYQQLQTPMMLLLLAGFYIGIFSPVADGLGFMKVMAFIPFFTPMLAPIVLITGVMTVFEAIVALVISTVVMLGSMYLVAPVYKVAILSYDQTNPFKRVFGYFKKAFSKNGKKRIVK